MKNFKRILALVIAVIMIAGTFATLSAAVAWYDGAVAFLESNRIATIGANANKPIPRNEFVLWAAKIESRQLNEAAWNDEIADTTFTDVNDTHHKAAIAYAARRHFMEGNGDGTFSPDKVVTLAEASAVIVRLMGYAEKVEFMTGGDWKYNNMQVAQTYVRAFDQTFLNETATYDPDYELSYGEAAYLLATILNFKVNYAAGEEPILTADRIDLGEALGVVDATSLTNIFYITKMDRAEFRPYNTSLADPADTRAAVSTAKLIHIAGDGHAPIKTNLVDAASLVELTPVGGGTPVTVPGDTFTQLVRISLGLPATADVANEEAEINVFQYCDLGSVIYATVSDTNEVTAVTMSDTSYIVDTYLQAEYAVSGTTRAFGTNYSNPAWSTNLLIPEKDIAKFIGWTIREVKPVSEASASKESMRVALPLSYTEDFVTSWTNVQRNPATGEVTDATLNFKGVAYKYGAIKDVAIVMADDFDTVLTPNEAVTTLINAAQGECLAVFNDVDGDGKIDKIVIQESDPFFYVGTPNAKGNNDSTDYTYYSSVSNGVALGTHKLKGFAMGAVILDQGIHHSAGASADANLYDYRGDGWSLDANEHTGKVQLVLRASNKHVVLDGWSDTYGSSTPEFYAIADLASFFTGIIDKVDAYAVEGYYKVYMTNTDGTPNTVYIPTVPEATTQFDVTIGGATATYTFDSSAWCDFLKQANKEAIIDAGIVGGVNDAAVKEATAAWMTGRFVQYATSGDIVISISGTDNKSSTTGYVLGVTSSDAGDNAFNVKLAKSGKGVVEAETYYLHASNEKPGYEGQWVVTDPLIALFDWGDLDDAHDYGAFDRVPWGTLTVFRYATNYYTKAYGYSGARQLMTNNKYFTATTDFVPRMSDGIHGALNGVAACNPWTVGDDGIVVDHNGKKVYFQKKTVARLGVASIATVEVRASASAMFDWENYATYNAIFDRKVLINPTAEAAAKAAPGKVKGSDLIYVTVYEDAGSKYLKVGDSTSGTTQMIQTVKTNSVSNQNTDAFYPQNTVPLGVVTGEKYIGTQASTSWVQVEGKTRIGETTMVPGSKFVAADESYYTAEYSFKEGVNPYYYRVWNSAKNRFEYNVRFETITKYAGVEGRAEAIVDKTKTLLIPLMITDASGNTVQVKLTDSNRPAYQAKIDAKEYYEDLKTNYLFKVESDDVYYMTDKNGNTVYEDVVITDAAYAAATVDAVYSGLGNETMLEYWKDSNGDHLLGLRDTLGIKEAPATTEGWFPGLYTFNFEGRDLQVSFYEKVVMLTPSSNGFSVSEMTVQEAAQYGVFAVSANFVEDSGKVGTITVIGEPAKEFGAAAPSTPSTPTPTDNNKLVYLSAGATTSVEAKQFGTKWVVITDGSAYALPTGENVGNIYRQYNTYQGEKPTNLDLSIVGGHWYKVTPAGAIVSDMTDVTYETIAITGDVIEAAGWSTKTVKVGTSEEAETVWFKTVDSVFVGFHKKADGTYEYVKETFVAGDPAAEPPTTDTYTYAADTAANKIGFCELDYAITTSGSIKYYTDATNGKYIVLEDGTYYAADADFRKVETSATLKGLKTAAIVGATANGGSTVTFDAAGKVMTDTTNYKFAFFYKNADKTVLYKAGDSTSVTVTTKAAYDAKIVSQNNAYLAAKTDYDNAVAKGYLSEARLAFYKNNLDEKEAALKEVKDSLLDQFYNGQFWNVPNSPFMRYQKMAQDAFQSSSAKITFNYIVVNGVYCVFSDEFVPQ